MIIAHDWSDVFGGFAFERGAQRGQVQVTVHAAELLAGLDHPGRAPAQRHLPVPPRSPQEEAVSIPRTDSGTIAEMDARSGLGLNDPFEEAVCFLSATITHPGSDGI